ncbi:MAG: helix-turn-helix domain-containing protein [Candidatus Undinarchaeales archaeon]|jgi:sugar-specific transcriptional regulator TrmB|nr:helix-turn-helix domain-containing protein [Candidatus Undinarchaeales archaeon]
MKVEDNTQNLLKRVGLNQYESAVYKSLLSRGVSTVGEIAESSKVPRSRVYDVLGSLEKKGFSLAQLGRPVKYAAVKPKMIVDKLKGFAETEYKQQLDHLDNVGNDLEKELGKIINTSGKEEGGISIIRGEDNIQNHIKEMISSAGKSILKVTDNKGLERLHKHHRVHLNSAKKRGVKTRIITSNHKAKLPDNFKSFADTRHNKNLNGRFLVKDGKEAFLLTSPNAGVWVKGNYLANSLGQMFEHAWTGSIVF